MRRPVGALTAVILVAVGLLPHPATADEDAPTPPLHTTSRYMQTIHPKVAFDLGCELGLKVLRGRGPLDAAVVLAFGMPIVKDGAPFGTSIFGPQASFEEIGEATFQFGLGYSTCVGPLVVSELTILVGTSNYGADVTYEHGQDWGSMVNAINSRLAGALPARRVVAWGASDIEPDWGAPSESRAWLDGYDSVALVPYGAKHQGARLHFVGVLTQFKACKDRFDPCTGVRNTPEEGWSQLYGELQSDPRTAQDLRWLTDIRWKSTGPLQRLGIVEPPPQTGQSEEWRAILSRFS